LDQGEIEMAYIPSPTSGLGVAAKVVPDVTTVALSVTGATYNGTAYPETHQLTVKIEDAAGNVQEEGVSLTLTSVANSSGGTAVYQGTITGGGTNLFKGFTFDIAGFAAHAANNGTFEVTANTTTSLTVTNANAVAETHAATAISEDSPYPITYVSYDSATASVSATGLITAVKAGQSIVEASYPTFNNSVGDIVSSGNIMNGLPIVKIYGDVVVQVYP
jgi:hypothetical protein